MFTLTMIIGRLIYSTTRLLQRHVGGNRMFSDMQRESHNLQTMLQALPPTMTHTMHKGQCGRIGIIGGCAEYTGAPYYAAITTLKVGGDLAHVFCCEQAASVIKSYSPELIVHPVLDKAGSVQEIANWLPRLHTVVIGPGLGRDPNVFNTVKGVIAKAKEMDIPLVIDADGVFLVTQDSGLVSGYTKAVLTPNAIEFSRLYLATLGSAPDMSDVTQSVTRLSQALGNVTIVRKGVHDVISDGNKVLVCDVEGSVRRCGGQGDLLSGSLGIFLHWAYMEHNRQYADEYGAGLCAGYAACALTRACNNAAYRRLRRAMTTVDMIDSIPAVFANLFEPERY